MKHWKNAVIPLKCIISHISLIISYVGVWPLRESSLEEDLIENINYVHEQ